MEKRCVSWLNRHDPDENSQLGGICGTKAKKYTRCRIAKASFWPLRISKWKKMWGVWLGLDCCAAPLTDFFHFSLAINCAAPQLIDRLAKVKQTNQSQTIQYIWNNATVWTILALSMSTFHFERNIVVLIGYYPHLSLNRAILDWRACSQTTCLLVIINSTEQNHIISRDRGGSRNF